MQFPHISVSHHDELKDSLFVESWSDTVGDTEESAVFYYYGDEVVTYIVRYVCWMKTVIVGIESSNNVYIERKY